MEKQNILSNALNTKNNIHNSEFDIYLDIKDL